MIYIGKPARAAIIFAVQPLFPLNETPGFPFGNIEIAHSALVEAVMILVKCLEDMVARFVQQVGDRPAGIVTIAPAITTHTACKRRCRTDFGAGRRKTPAATGRATLDG